MLTTQSIHIQSVSHDNREARKTVKSSRYVRTPLVPHIPTHTQETTNTQAKNRPSFSPRQNGQPRSRFLKCFLNHPPCLESRLHLTTQQTKLRTATQKALEVCRGKSKEAHAFANCANDLFVSGAGTCPKYKLLDTGEHLNNTEGATTKPIRAHCRQLWGGEVSQPQVLLWRYRNLKL